MELIAPNEAGPLDPENEENEGVLDKPEVFDEDLDENEDLEDIELERVLGDLALGVGAEARNNLIKCLVFFLRTERQWRLYR